MAYNIPVYGVVSARQPAKQDKGFLLEEYLLGFAVQQLLPGGHTHT
jgi:hypothetical protein